MKYGPKIVTDGLVLCLDAADRNSYPGSGTIWRDLSGNGNHGTLTNGPAFSAANGGSIVFDGVNDYINSIQSYSMQLTGNMSILCWFKPYDYSSSRQGLIGRNGLNEYTITLETAGTISFYFQSSNQPSNYYNGASFRLFGQENNVWQHLTVTRDFSTNINFYKNSLFASQNTSDLTVVDHPASTSGPMTIGYGNGGYYKGEVGAVSIYNRALSAAEIKQNYNTTKTRFGH
jgi:hypothetical protein